MLRKVLKIGKRYKNVIKRLSLIIVSCIHKAKNLKYCVRLYDEFGFSYEKDLGAFVLKVKKEYLGVQNFK